MRLDQSTAGRRLNQLEAELGAVLFVRSKSGFTPTQAGEAAISRALDVEMNINRLVDTVAST
ncbi:MAG TPA: LysR family transcriptional regulator, partial [Rhodobacteraceae bacterium]|nr:LysR family transcriptional regulator [Paracoccaceae bacterium]